MSNEYYTIESIDLNFSSGGGHSATVKARKNVKTVGGALFANEINGTLGEAYNFTASNSLNYLMKNFIGLEESESKDPSGAVKKNIKFRDESSLILESHAIALRGETVSPRDEDGDEPQRIYEYSEVPSLPNGMKHEIVAPPKKTGAIFRVGKAYSVTSGMYEREPYQLGFQAGVLSIPISYNIQKGLQDPEANILENYKLQYWYNVEDVRLVLEELGFQLTNFPSTDFLFNHIGSLSDVLSSVAKTLGFYWHTHPIKKEIVFISSQEAAEKQLNERQYLDDSRLTSYTTSESIIQKAIFNSYIGDFEYRNQEISAETIQTRKLNFYAVGYQVLFNQKIIRLLSFYYGLFLSGVEISNFAFDAFTIYGLASDPLFADAINSLNPQMINLGGVGQDFLNWDSPEIFNVEERKNQLSFSNKQFGSRDDAKFVSITNVNFKEGEGGAGGVKNAQPKIPLPSSSPLKSIIEALFFIIHNKLYATKTLSEFKAMRMTISGDNLDVIGPFKKDAKLKDISQLSFLNPFFDIGFLKEDLTLEDFLPTNRNGEPLEKENVNIRHDYMFLGIMKFPLDGRPSIKNAKEAGAVENLFAGKWANEENIELFFENPVHGTTFAGFKKDVLKKFEKYKPASEKAFKSFKKTYELPEFDEDDGDEGEFLINKGTIRETFVMHKRPVNDPELDPEEGGPPLGDSPTINGQNGEDLSEKFTDKFYDVADQNADGKLYHPVSLNVQQGHIENIKIIKDGFEKSSNQKNMKSVSHTLYGLELSDVRDFDITLDSISINFTADQGITTTISKSTKSIIPLSDNNILTDHFKSIDVRTDLGLNARQKNFLGI